MSELSEFPVGPSDAALVRNVRPDDWVNPVPSGRYNLVVIGAGTAGLITASVAAGLGAKVALVERHLMGGDCLNVGCVPSKGLIRASRMAAEARRARDELGLPLADGAAPDFARAMERMRRARARISEDDSAVRYRDELGVDVYLGQARFTGSDAVLVEGRRLRFAKAVVTTGARAAGLPIEGLESAGYRTNGTIFDLTERPRHLGVIGAGPIGCELSQAFRRLGSEVTVVHADAHVLPREDEDAARLLEQRLAAEGVRVVNSARIEKVEVRNASRVIRIVHADGQAEELPVDEILLSVGRAPNVEGLDLDRVGVRYDARRGIHVDDHLRTTNARIYAAGDVCMRWQFTHAADAAAKIVVQNALFYPTKKLSSLVMPWCTYTDPEIAHVGMYERDARAAGIEVDTYRVPLAEVNRAVLDGDEEGFVKVHVRKGRDEILGASIVASHAGELISVLTTAIVGRLGLSSLGDTIFPYPTQAEGIKRAAGLYTRSRLTPRLARLFGHWMRWRR
jgi:pyruvate/2-oxoglutarate dehydrogenase complex dihydrolipoamide dehydrogenase (E3) component